MTIFIQRASVADAGEILSLQILAYRSEAEIYGDFSIPPLAQTQESIEDEFQHTTFLKALRDKTIVGSVRAFLRDGTCFIGRLIVHPQAQNQGIGSRLMNAIESEFSQAERFELFTGHQSERNLYLYRKLGYTAFKTMPVNERLSLIYLEKKNVSLRFLEAESNGKKKPLSNLGGERGKNRG